MTDHHPADHNPYQRFLRRGRSGSGMAENARYPNAGPPSPQAEPSRRDGQRQGALDGVLACCRTRVFGVYRRICQTIRPALRSSGKIGDSESKSSRSLPPGRLASGPPASARTSLSLRSGGPDGRRLPVGVATADRTDKVG